VNRRRALFRALGSVPVAIIAMLALAGCEVHAGAAATVDGSTISERTLSSYLNPTIPALTDSAGNSTAARTFVLQALLQEKVLEALFNHAAGGPPTAAQLAAAKASLLSQSQTTEAAVLKQVTSLGLPAKLEPHLLHTEALAVLLPQRLGSQAEQEAAVKKFGGQVSVSPRYGQWNPATLTLTEFGKNQVPSVVTYTAPLPGDVSASPAP
jgi:hypothetical protein